MAVRSTQCQNTVVRSTQGGGGCHPQNLKSSNCSPFISVWETTVCFSNFSIALKIYQWLSFKCPGIPYVIVSILNISFDSTYMYLQNVPYKCIIIRVYWLFNQYQCFANCLMFSFRFILRVLYASTLCEIVAVNVV